MSNYRVIWSNRIYDMLVETSRSVTERILYIYRYNEPNTTDTKLLTEGTEGGNVRER